MAVVYEHLAVTVNHFAIVCTCVLAHVGFSVVVRKRRRQRRSRGRACSKIIVPEVTLLSCAIQVASSGKVDRLCLGLVGVHQMNALRVRKLKVIGGTNGNSLTRNNVVVVAGLGFVLDKHSHLSVEVIAVAVAH
jgi:hypothetical protein